LEPYKDIDIKIVGCRKGERLIEPLWLEEENPTATEYKKLLTLENKPYDSQRLNKLIEELYPICYFTSDKESDFRNKEKLLKIVCEDCESLKNFYDELKTTDRKQTDLL
jgi:FlaA1/EpsC-like NDP-sugar epimerase